MKNKSVKPNVTDKIKKIYNQGPWCVALESIFINDNHWWSIVTMMVETIVDDSRYICLFNEAADKEKQRCLYSLSYQKAIITVKTLSKQDPEKCPVIQSICHYANMILNENNGNLSTWLMARIIKYLIYRVKIESQSIVRPEKVDNSETEHLNGKTNTRLRKRGKELRDFVHTDDVLSDGPDLYVILSGFHDPDLPVELLSVGVPLTCILEIKSSEERHIVYHEMKEKDLMLQKEPYLFGDYCISENELFEFWTVTHERLTNPLAYPIYSDVAILTFCPSVLPDSSFITTEKESLMRDIYDRISLILRHLYDLYRQHANYLKSMRLEKAIVSTRGETADIKIYEDVLSDIPNEYINIPLILCAMLLQVETNLAKPSDECPLVNSNAEFSDIDTRYENTFTTVITERDPKCTVQDKLKLLDFKYELCDIEYIDSTNRSSQPSDIKLIPYGDTLKSIARRFLNHKSINLIDAVLHIIRNPRIINMWRDHKVLTESKANMYFCHIDNIARSYSRKRAISRDEVVHYLHLLMFDTLIFSENKHNKEARLMQSLKSELQYVRPTVKRTYSMPDLTSLTTSTSTSSLRRSRSDAEINYGKSVAALTECPLLFALTDTRETLLSGYLYENVFEKTSSDRSTIEEYEDVELLSDRVFLQTAYECFQSFDRLVATYFEPTDSVLLYFSNNNEVDTMSEETRLSSIRTPVRLREFCKYIAHEEKNWIKREQESCQSNRTDLTGRFMKRSVEMEDDAIIFDNECFVLRDSLKAHRLKMSLNYDMRKKISEETKKSDGATGEDIKEKKTTGQKRNETAMVSNSDRERANGRVTSGRTSMTEKKLDSMIDDVDTSFLPVKKILSSRCVERSESYDFVGYDLGNIRVQVSHRSKKFLLRDDTSVRVELEDWLYGDLDLRIAVTLQDCTLRLSSGVSCRSADTFHLITKRGIVLGFCRNHRELEAVGRNLAFDFRVSWPSGLLIEPTIGDGTKNPFCIRQSYVSKCSERAGAAREVYRNFLRNGTVLKYLDDNTVVILRPNGVIVTCTDLDKPQSHESTYRTILRGELKVRKGDVKEPMVHKRREQVIDSMHSSESIVDTLLKHVLSAKSITDCPLTTTTFAKDVLRYSVVNYDGRHYEVLNDLIVSEHDRLLVRTASDYEVNEIFTRRADGTDMLLRSNGELIVTFADGTRITTSYMIEEQPVICEWSENELRRYFGLSETNKYDNGNNDASSTDNKFPHQNSSVSDFDDREKLTKLSIADSFVSIMLTFCIEHKDYATVFYDQSAVRCTLSMPDDLCVSISRRGHYEVSMGSEVNLKICDNNVVFSKVCTTCGGRSISTYKFPESAEAGSRTILTTIDIVGNVLEVKSDGTTRYHREGRKYECNGDVLENIEEKRSNEEDANSEARFHCKHERYCEKLKFPARSQYRIFAMNRDLTACEYLHRSVRREQEVAAVFDDETSMIQYPISRRPELRRLITFVPMEPELRSKEISYQQVTSDKWLDGRIDLSRSTYSFPYDWLFPFGKRDKKVSKKMQNKTLSKKSEQQLPKLLQVRIFFGIKEADESILIDMHRIMGRYWITVFRDGDKCRLFYVTGSNRFCEVENDYENSEDRDLRDLALGVKKSIDVQTYIKGLQSKLIKVSTETLQQSSRFTELLRQRDLIEQEYEWYKQCMRRRIILPYFRNIADVC